MTKQEAAIISAYTGILIGEVNETHKYIEKLLDRPVLTHELGGHNIWASIKELSKNDFLNIEVV